MNEAAPPESGRPPPLREELHLFPGPRTPEGSPTWTLRDPANNQFYRLGWREFEILCRWRRGAPARIAELVSTETPLETTSGDVQELVRFLLGANLLRPQGERGLERLTRNYRSKQQSWFQKILHAYLFFRIPLFDPDRWLQKTLPWVRWAFSKKFFLASGVAGLMGLHFIMRQWEIAMATFSETDMVTEVLFITLAMFLTKAIHELGHAYAAVRYGCRVPTIGVAFLMLLPVLYTDTSEVWKVASRHRRLVVAAAGIIAELLLTAWASLLWGLLPSGGTKDALFFLATVSWISTLVLNASPFLRFDGYYLFADWLGIDNLHDRAGALGRWKLREVLLGLGAPFPDAVLYARRRLLIFFAWVTWIYRFFLYLGIALAVYHLFFKALGMILMAVEIGWFLVRPVVSEFKTWFRPGSGLRVNRRVVISLLGLGALIGALAIPWHATVQAPAMLERSDHVTLFSPAPARIREVLVHHGQEVLEGTILLQLDAPDLDNQVEVLRHKIDLSLWKLQFRGTDPGLLKHSLVNDKELEVDLTQYRELQRQQKRLTVTAPFDGWVALPNRDLVPGVWLANNEPLVEIAHPEQWRLTAYVRETDLTNIRPGNEARFLADSMDWAPIAARIAAIAPLGATTLDEIPLANQHGGNVPARKDDKGHFIPTTAVYRVTLHPTDAFPQPPHVLRGSVVMESHVARSLLSRIQREAMEILVRETGL
ncbi:MAG: HlyD family efflux transporter periplasmic adaptor subunit [Magnetococcales bacterium]|nr:HlyD family efflux transporter periplasmic adaptor subunit [Magnetococcales bacterium]